MVKFFDCQQCGAHGKIVFKEDEFKAQDVAYCPFCSGDIYEDEPNDDQED